MESTHALRVLPAFFLFLLPQLVTAQVRYRVLNDGEAFHREAGGRQLARLARGALVDGAGEEDGEWLRVTLGGWIWGASVGATSRDGFDLTVTAAPEENLRSGPAGALLAKLATGFLLTKVEEDGRWIRVQRSGWVKRAGLEPAGGAPAVPAAAAAPASPDSTAAGAVDPGRVQPSRATSMYRAPDGPEAGTLVPDAPVRVLGRSGEWTRVQIEAWVRSADLETAPSGALVGVSAAELRAQPERYTGRVLRWTLQYLSAQVADALRPDIPSGGTYLLARGPQPERGFVYVVVPEGRRGLIEGLTPLATLRVTVRVRAGRSRYIGNPVVDLLTLEVVP
jgi:hypothetical protein